MLRIKDNVKINDLVKYGFNILISDEEYAEQIERDETDIYCTRAEKNLGNSFHLVVETDLQYNQLTIVPNHSWGFCVCISWQLDTLYDLIKDGIVEKVD